jgi:hypothetical protein
MSTLRTNALLDASGGTTATVNGIPLRPGVLDPENRIINGAFDFWQRGTSSTAQGYLADRWINATGGGTVTMSRQAFTLGDTLGSNSPTYFLRQTVSGQSTSGQYAITQQRVESVRSYAGQTITILGWARRSSGSGNMAVELVQDFGTGGSPSADVEVTGQTVTLTGSFVPFAVTFSVPSISGKTLGSNNNDYLLLNFWTSAGSDWNARTNSLGLQTIGVDLWGIHIKQGTHTTSAVDLYRQPEPWPELVRCQRYYRLSPLGAPLTVTSNTTVMHVTIPFDQPMRATPSVTQTTTDVYGIAVGPNASSDYSSTNSSLSTINADASGVARIRLAGLGATPIAHAYYSLNTASKFGLDAEL